MLKSFLLTALVGFSFAAAAQPAVQPAGQPAGQSAGQSAAGHLRYEVTRRLDAPKIIGLDGVELKPSSPDYPADLPDVFNHGMTLAFDGTYAREDGEETSIQLDGDGGRAQTARSAASRPALDPAVLRPSYAETTHARLADRTQVRVLTVGAGAQETRYRTEASYTTPPDWRETGRRKTIVGRAAREATPWRAWPTRCGSRLNCPSPTRRRVT